jgi:hypothetical protein
MQAANYSRMNKNNLENRINAYRGHLRGPGRNYPQNYKNWYKTQINAINRELTRRARNAAKRRWNTLRKHVTAKSIASYWTHKTLRPPGSPGSPGGAGYRRRARQTNVGRKRARNNLAS